MCTHDHIEKWNEKCKWTANHTDEKQWLGLKLVLGLGKDDKFEQDVNRQLREILRKERHKAYKTSEDFGLAKDIEGVVNAEWVEDGGKKHVLSNEGHKAGTFQIWLEESIA